MTDLAIALIGIDGEPDDALQTKIAAIPQVRYAKVLSF